MILRRDWDLAGTGKYLSRGRPFLLGSTTTVASRAFALAVPVYTAHNVVAEVDRQVGLHQSQHPEAIHCHYASITLGATTQR